MLAWRRKRASSYHIFFICMYSYVNHLRLRTRGICNGMCKMLSYLWCILLWRCTIALGWSRISLRGVLFAQMLVSECVYVHKKQLCCGMDHSTSCACTQDRVTPPYAEYVYTHSKQLVTSHLLRRGGITLLWVVLLRRCAVTLRRSAVLKHAD